MNGLVRFAQTAILGAIFCVATKAGADSAAQGLEAADSYIERVRADWKYAGVALAVVSGDEVIYAHGFGVRELGKTAPITADTLFEIGSTSKAFTTAALGILVDEGKMGAADHDWSNDYLTRLQATQRAARKEADELRLSRLTKAPALPLEKYAGFYEDRSVQSSRVRVQVENGRLAMDFAGEGAFSGYLEHWHDNVFRLHSKAAGHNTVQLGFADFAIDPAGKAASLSISSAFFKFELARSEQGN